MASSSNEILHDLSPLMRVYKDGRIERLEGEDVVPASLDPDTSVQSKDIEFHPELKLSARLYLPKISNPTHKLPLLVYFHGGGFLIQSAFATIYQKPLNSLAAEANIVIVSVNYRLAPEFLLPIAYEDSWCALQWIASHSIGDGNEAWIKEFADLNRVYLGGDSSGGNIAHNMAIRAGLEGLKIVNINGVFLNCPFFWGKEPIGNEASDSYSKTLVDRVWEFVYPNSSGGLDDPLLNPAKDLNLSKLRCKKVLVFVAGEDLLKHRGWMYKKVLSEKWDGNVEVVEVAAEGHVFNLFNPTSENAISMVKRLASFINSD